MRITLSPLASPCGSQGALFDSNAAHGEPVKRKIKFKKIVSVALPRGRRHLIDPDEASHALCALQPKANEKTLTPLR